MLKARPNVFALNTESVRTELVFADVHEFLGGLEFDGGAALVVRVRLPAAKRLERRVVDKLCLLDHVEREIHPFIRRLRDLAPVEEVVVVDDAPAEVILTEDGDVVGAVLIGEWAHEAVAEARLADALGALLFLRPRQANHAHINNPVLRLLSHYIISHTGTSPVDRQTDRQTGGPFLKHTLACFCPPKSQCSQAQGHGEYALNKSHGELLVIILHQ